MAFWATASSLSWLSRLSMSMGPISGLLTLSSATASGTPLLRSPALQFHMTLVFRLAQRSQ